MAFPTTKRPEVDILLFGHIPDVDTAGQIYIPCPDKGRVVKILSSLDADIGAGDITLTPKIGGTALTNGAVTIAGSSGAGTVDSSEPSANHHILEGQALEIETDGGAASGGGCHICAVIRR